MISERLVSFYARKAEFFEELYQEYFDKFQKTVEIKKGGEAR